MEKSLRRARWRTTDSEYFRRLWGVVAPVLKALAWVEYNSSSCGVYCRLFVGPRYLLENVGNSLGVWQTRCLQPDGDWWSLDVCWRYLVEAPIGWKRLRPRSGSCGVQKKIIDPRWTPVDDIWPEADVCWGSLVGAGVGSGYLVGIDVSWGRWCPNWGPGRATTLWLHRWPVVRLVDVVWVVRYGIPCKWGRGFHNLH